MLKLLLFATVAVFAVSSAARGAAAGPAAPNEPAAEPARAAARAAQAAKAPAAKQTCFELDMPPRLQWPQNDGWVFLTAAGALTVAKGRPWGAQQRGTSSSAGRRAPCRTGDTQPLHTL